MNPVGSGSPSLFIPRPSAAPAPQDPQFAEAPQPSGGSAEQRGLGADAAHDAQQRRLDVEAALNLLTPPSCPTPQELLEAYFSKPEPKLRQEFIQGQLTHEISLMAGEGCGVSVVYKNPGRPIGVAPLLPASYRASIAGPHSRALSTEFENHFTPAMWTLIRNPEDVEQNYFEPHDVTLAQFAQAILFQGPAATLPAQLRFPQVDDVETTVMLNRRQGNMDLQLFVDLTPVGMHVRECLRVLQMEVHGLQWNQESRELIVMVRPRA